jgi:hypothetical protein
VLAPNDLFLLTSGATGLDNCTADPTEPPSSCPQPDTRVKNFDALPNTVFQITNPHLKYDSYTGDMVHRFFHMWQQSDCHAARRRQTIRPAAATICIPTWASRAATTRAATPWASTTCCAATRPCSSGSPTSTR